jgi:SART-1 family
MAKVRSLFFAFYDICGLLMCFIAEDLVGLKVAHDFDEMDEGEARILTLKDSRILDNEGLFSFLFFLSRRILTLLENRGRAPKCRNG